MRSTGFGIQARWTKDKLGVTLDCPARWSRTFLILSRFETIKAELDGFFAMLKKNAGTKHDFSDTVLTSPSSEDWFAIRCLSTLLQPFASVTERQSGEEYPTFVLVFPYLRLMKQYLQADDIFDRDAAAVASELYTEDIVDQMNNIRRVVLQLFTQRFKGMTESMMWVALLDPRLADMVYLEEHERDRARDYLIRAMVEAEEGKRPASPAPSAPRPSLFSPPRPPPSVMDMFDAQLFGKKRVEPAPVSSGDRGQQLMAACTAEAFDYFNLVVQHKPTDSPLIWWKANHSRFPIMSELARKWLGCPSERAFATAGNIVTVKRASLTPEMVESLTMIAQNAKEANY